MDEIREDCRTNFNDLNKAKAKHDGKLISLEDLANNHYTTLSKDIKQMKQSLGDKATKDDVGWLKWMFGLGFSACIVLIGAVLGVMVA